ncbi:AsmA family protein [Azospirillum baldaniorum]|uniref:AsmA family protein n=1 Tax=Azospirillum baldaniorum TaxID=1064539 RepID=UPI0002DBBA5A|nr:AsmA family protein [Azospirillum baldaniorum]
MKKLLIAALILLGLLVAAVLIVPSVVDWNAYKSQIAERVSAATGREVELRGDIGLSLLPAPALTVRDARLANAPGGSEQDMARLKELDVRVALGPLLSGHIQVQSIRLIDPTFLFETLPDGRFNWDLSGAGRPADGGRGGSGDGLASAVSFDQVTVQNGTIQYRDARTGQSEVIDQVDARIVAGSFTGPFQGQGSFRARGVPLRGEMFVSRLIDGAAVQVRATLSMADTDATLRFAGIVTNPPGSGGSRAQGDLRAEGSDLSRVLALVRSGSAAGEDRKANALLAQSFGIRTAVEASPTAASFTNLEAQLGDTRATGTATLHSGTPARAELTLALNRLDLDAWLERARSGGGSESGTPPAARNGNAAKGAPSTSPSGGAPSGGTPSGGAGQPGGFALPDALDAKLDLAVDGITYNGGVMRQGRVEASLSGGTLNIDRVSALLPGGSDIVAAGELAAANGQPNLNLRMEANADNLRALLEWLRVDVRAVPGGPPAPGVDRRAVAGAAGAVGRERAGSAGGRQPPDRCRRLCGPRAARLRGAARPRPVESRRLSARAGQRPGRRQRGCHRPGPSTQRELDGRFVREFVDDPGPAAGRRGRQSGIVGRAADRAQHAGPGAAARRHRRGRRPVDQGGDGAGRRRGEAPSGRADRRAGAAARRPSDAERRGRQPGRGGARRSLAGGRPRAGAAGRGEGAGPPVGRRRASGGRTGG